MNYSSEFIQRAAQAAQARRSGVEWTSLPIGERVVLIYREMQRAEADWADGLVSLDLDAHRRIVRTMRRRTDTHVAQGR